LLDLPDHGTIKPAFLGNWEESKGVHIISEIEFVVLGCLTRNNMSGYQITKFINTTTNFSNPINFGSIYPVLKNLSRENLVRATPVVRNGRLVKIYEITDEGKKRFASWLEEPLKSDVVKSDLGNRLFFSRLFLPPEQIASMIQQYIDKTNQEIAVLEKIRKELIPSMDRFQAFCMDLTIERRRFYINLYKGLLEELKDQNPG
jgi:PadR family transcriptional regulator AphA